MTACWFVPPGDVSLGASIAQLSAKLRGASARCERKMICRPSALQDGCVLLISGGKSVSCLRPVPSQRTTHTSSSCLNAIHCPSGDQLDCSSLLVLNVSR